MTSLLLFFSLWNPALPARTDTIPPKHKVFKTTILTNTASKASGYFYTLSDSTISLVPDPLPKRNFLATKATVRSFNYQELNSVLIRRNGSTGRGALYGALVGAGGGILAGFIEGDDETNTWFYFTAEQKALIYGLVFSVTGAIMGLIIGALVRKRFTIGGKREAFQEMKTTLLQKVYGARQR